MSKFRCGFCFSESMLISKEVKTFKKKNLPKLVEVFRGIRIATSKKQLPSICKKCFHRAKVAYKLNEKCQNRTVKKRLSRFSKRRIKPKSQNASSQLESGKFILILNQIPKELFLKDFSEDRLKSIFCEYGIISDVYLCESYYDNFARITFRTEQTSSNTWEAIQNKIKKVYGNQVAATLIAENKSPIDVLPDNFLQRIFLYIDELSDKIEIEDVCQRWQKLALIIWTNLEKLCSDEVDGGLSIDKFERTVMHCKESLTEIHIIAFEDAERQFKAVTNNCDNLKKLAIKYFNGSPKEFEEYAKPLFTAKQKLEKLLLKDVYSSCNFDFLNHLPEKMVEIHLYAEHENSQRTNSQMDFSKFQNLRVLYLYSFEFSNENSLSGLENLVNLEYLKLLDSTVHSSTFEKMRNLTKLKHLEIPSQTVNDDILSIIIRNNQNLEEIDISNNPNILNNSLRMIGELPELRKLQMMNLHDLDGSPLSKLHKLTDLDCRGCSSITDWELMTLIDRAPNLDSIDATDCDVTLRLLVSANETIKKRQSINTMFLVLDEKLVIFWPKIPCRSPKIRVKSCDTDSLDLDWDDWVIGD